MSPGVVVERIEVADPIQAAGRGATLALHGCGRTRPTVALLVDHGHRPGLAVCPWTVDALVHSARTEGLQLTGHRIDPMSPEPAADARLIRRDVPRALAATVDLAVPAARRPLRIPRAWIGAHACVLTPWVIEAAGSADPLQRSLGALARACTRESLRSPTDVGRWLVEHVFASAGVVVDAGWTTVVDSAGPHLTAAERLVAASSIDDADLGEALAGWRPRPDRFGPGLSRRRVNALWKRQAAAPVAPGPLARRWNSYVAAEPEAEP